MPVRRATIEDVDAIAQVHVQCWREAYAGLMPAALLDSLTTADRAKSRERFMSDPNGRVASFVATDETGAAIQGFGDCGPQRDKALADLGFAGEVFAIYVLRSAQRRGFGRGLMGAMAGAMAARGYGGASAWVLRGNSPARRFYEAIGGALIGERKDERSNIQPGLVLDEVAYGFRDLATLAAR